MNLTAEQQKELAAFPDGLRALLEAELAAGNSIVEVGHSFPAPPAGAYFKLANKISTRPRASGSGIDFYERNSSIYSGEFTDSKRFYFILEPPNPPPPEPDMDAIRKAHEPKPDSLTQLAQRPTGSSVEVAIGESASSLEEAEVQEKIPNSSKLRRCLITTETATGVKRILHFRDKRPPHEVQFALERELMTLFGVSMDNRKLRLLANGNVNGARYFFELCFEAALLLTNCYSLRIETSWADQAASHHEYYRKTSDSWFNLWTRDLMAANPPGEGELEDSTERYQKLAEAALKAEAHLDSVAEIQQTIVTEMKRGGSFRTSHKEGGTNIYWKSGCFIRSDFGDYPRQQEFKDEAEFLQMLRQFCHCDIARHAGPDKRSEFDAWKLILRQLRHK